MISSGPAESGGTAHDSPEHAERLPGADTTARMRSRLILPVPRCTTTSQLISSTGCSNIVSAAAFAYSAAVTVASGPSDHFSLCAFYGQVFFFQLVLKAYTRMERMQEITLTLLILLNDNRAKYLLSLSGTISRHLRRLRLAYYCLSSQTSQCLLVL